jgi:hypothetical protein
VANLRNGENPKEKPQVFWIRNAERFTQSVANILPGEKITIEITTSKLEIRRRRLRIRLSDDVGPRYNPASSKMPPAFRRPSPKPAPDTTFLLNKSRRRVPIEEIRSGSHEIVTTNSSSSVAKIVLKNEKNDSEQRFHSSRYDVTRQTHRRRRFKRIATRARFFPR